MQLQHHLDRRAASLVSSENATGSPDDLLTTHEIADWLGVSRQWLEIGRCKGYGPPFVRVAPKLIRYRRKEVVSWLDSRIHCSTASYS